MNPIVIKSNAYGLVIRLDKEMSFEELEKVVREKFKESADFFKKGKLAVAFEGRKLTSEEEFQLVKAISEAGKFTVTCVIEKDKEAERIFGNKVKEKTGRLEQQGDGQFYKGTLRNGQTLEAESSLVILGDVNPGATVYSAGNVVILGTLAGSVYAGGSGTESAFVAALDMHPMQIRIGDVIARGADKRKKEPVEPKIAFVEDGNIYIEKINREVINDLPII